MSTRSTLFFGDGAHIYRETSPEKYGEEFIPDALVLDLPAEQLLEVDNDKDGVCITVRPGTALYRALLNIR